MKSTIHPADYRPVVFEDTSNGFKFLTRSTAQTEETIKWEDGNEYPLVKVHISSESHPFYTGKEKLVDIEGRVDRFKAQAKRAAERRDTLAKSAAKKTARKAKIATKDQKDSIEDVGGQPTVSKKSNQKSDDK